MEEIEGVNCSSESRPPHPNPSIASAFRQCQRNDPVVLPCRKSLVRHASLVRIFLFYSNNNNNVTNSICLVSSFVVLEQLFIIAFITFLKMILIFICTFLASFLFFFTFVTLI
jgi:hypothetical protein